MHFNFNSINILLLTNKIFRTTFIYLVFLLASTQTFSVYSQSTIPTTNANNNANCCTNVTTLQSNQSLLNTFYPPQNNQTINPGSTSIVLDAVPQVDVFGNSYGNTPIRAGDLLLIIQMQGATFNSSNTSSFGAGIANSGIDNLGATGYISLENTGNFEYVIAINAVPLSGGTLQISGDCNGGLSNTYQNLSSTASSVIKRFQVVRVPRYQNLTLSNNITTTAWNGSVGGIISFVVSGELDLNGFTIDATGRGFRGGFQNVRESGGNNNIITTTNNLLSSGKGEGVSGTPRFVWNGINAVDYGTSWLGYPGGDYGRGAPANAGGGGNTHNAGGGGGANGGFGGVGGNGHGPSGGTSSFPIGGRMGSSIPFSSGKIVMGGGGGGGDANNATTGIKGGSGGGIIMLQVGKIKGLGQLTANGLGGQPGVFSNAPDGAGGGGSGGSIQIVTSQSSPLANIVIEVKGGKGGNTLNDLNDPHGPGGGGGGGTVMHNIQGANLSINVNGESNGFTNNGTGISHGASPGQNGLIIQYTNNNLPLSVVNTYPNPIASFTANNTCVNDVFQPLNTSNVSTLNNSTLISYLWSFGDGTTSSNINPSHTYTNSGNFEVVLEVTTNWGCKNSYTKTITVNPNITPTFNQVPAICTGAILSALPTTSSNGITGTWTPALNNTATTTYTFTPTAGQCATTTLMLVTVNPTTASPTGSATQIFCATPTPTVASLVATGTVNKWYATATGGASLSNTTTLINGATYYASQTVNGCESLTRFAVVANINDAQITASASTICSGLSTTLSVNYTPPTICNMNITPTTIPLGNPIPGFTYKGLYNGHYYYVYNTPTSWTEGELICRQNGGYLVCINDINENTFVSNLTNNNIWIGLFRDPVTCNFRWLDCMNITFTNWRPGEPNGDPCGEPYTQIIRGCSFGLNTWNNLNNNSSNGSCYSNMVPIMEIDPIIYNNPISATTTYLWSTGETTSSIVVSPNTTTNYWVDIINGSIICRKEISINVNPIITPSFTQVPAICTGATLSALPTSSSNGITGTWTPALNNTATTTYTFTPTAGQCATTQAMTIAVNPNITPAFTQVSAICSGAILSALPTTSSNGITGTWLPALNNIATTTYTFTPTTGQCATTTLMLVTVNPLPITPSVSTSQSFCAINNPTINNLSTNGNVINWYLTATGGTPLSLNYPLVNGLVVYAAGYNAITKCESITRLKVSIQVQNPVLPNIMRQQTFCLEGNKTLGDLSTNGVEMKWYDNISGGSAIPLSRKLQNGDLFYGAAFNATTGCESSSRVPVEIKVNNPNLTFFNYISIDDNDLNKELIIQGLEQFPINTIGVYNRFGNLVWSGANYDNLNNTFKGMSSANGTVSKGSYLPTGTYFFILSYPNNCDKSRIKGFIQIDNKR